MARRGTGDGGWWAPKAIRAGGDTWRLNAIKAEWMRDGGEEVLSGGSRWRHWVFDGTMINASGRDKSESSVRAKDREDSSGQ